MPRKPRLHYPGAVYHVMLRGNAGDPIFFEDCDRYRLYLILQYAVEKFGCRIHAFCLMTNHLHLVVQVAEIPLSRVMQSISLRYTKWINFRRSRTGHLFQGRYKALLLDADAYLLELVRYVHLNPVRAGMAERPEDHLWSGHRAYLGEEVLPWLTTEWVMAMLAPTGKNERNAYRRFVADGIAFARKDEFHSGTCEGWIIGDERFVDRVLCEAEREREWNGALEDVIAGVCRVYGITEEQLKAPGKSRMYAEARAAAALLVQETKHLSLTELAKYVRRDLSGLGRAAARLAREATENPALAEKMAHLRCELGRISESQA